MAMWRPPERIRFLPSQAPWPDAATAACSRLFAPLEYQELKLTSRTWVPAMVPWRATDDGVVTNNNLQWYERFARGQPGALVVEATGIRDVPSGPLLRIGHDRFLPGLRELAATIKRASGGQTRAIIQIIDFLAIRRRPDRERFLREFLRIGAHHREPLGLRDAPEASVRAALANKTDTELQILLAPREWEAMTQGARERVTDMDLDHISELPQVLPGQFAAAARRAREAGFDGVELHFAHAYTMASFLSPLNTRSDGNGGSLANRLRLPLEVYQAVRAAVSSDFVVGCRYLAEECIAGGGTVPEAVIAALAFARAGMDFLSLSRGGKFDDARQPKVGEAAYPYTGRSGYECMPSYYSDAVGPFGRNTTAAAAIRRSLRDANFRTPVVLAGGMHHFAQAESALSQGAADVIGFARQALADPDWFRKVRLGRGAQVRQCIYTNYCEALDQRHREVTCELWDRERLDEPAIHKSQDGKRRLIPPDWDESQGPD